MKKTTVKLTALAIMLGSIPNNTEAQQAAPINVVTSAVPFLRISPDARSGGMGDVGIATSADANSAFWNIGKVAFGEEQGSAAITYTPWLKDLGLNDVYLATMAGYYKLDETQAISATMRFFNLGNIQFTDALGNEISTFRPREFSISGGYSRKLSEKLGLGVSLRYINSNLAGNNVFNGQAYRPASAVSGDIGIYHKNFKADGSGLSYGVMLSNLGSKISYTNDANQRDYIPANLGIGVAYTKVFDEVNKITFAVDINKLLVPTPPLLSTSSGGSGTTDDSIRLANYRNQGVISSWFKSFGDAPGGFSEEIKELQVSAGAEFWYNNQFALRAGYFYENPLKGNRKYFTVGAGLKYETFGLNFSYLVPSGSGVNRNPLSNTIRFSLVFDFDGGDKKDKE
ncbi:MAG TPA: type IX secretion system outer membrane channel protein PorV [Ferruginibacter sp.]|nr:type IX secretion system outer membrane channel protein PorV [Ferruginibacter sp.]HMP22058.1 type IX secretion system outer membrane channel protein PorV [Ferruginibacter sp.]